jgi:hypothetical protein
MSLSTKTRDKIRNPLFNFVEAKRVKNRTYFSINQAIKKTAMCGLFGYPVRERLISGGI